MIGCLKKQPGLIFTLASRADTTYTTRRRGASTHAVVVNGRASWQRSCRRQPVSCNYTRGPSTMRAICPVCDQTATVSTRRVMTAHESSRGRCSGTGGPPGRLVVDTLRPRPTAAQERDLLRASRKALAPNPRVRPRLVEPAAPSRQRRNEFQAREIKAPAPRPAVARRSTTKPGGVGKAKSFESRRKASSASQRIYEAEAVALKKASLDRGIVPRRKPTPDPTKKRWVESIVGGGSPGLGKR
ncbi:hypothetical protein RCH12_003372 [Cryobacterium sp. MP_3.1]|nr:hypothetical protein [Cryobacterium sp. MP_3.1]